MNPSRNIRRVKNEEEKAASRLKDVISELREGSDIDGAVLIGEKDAIIAYDLPPNGNFEGDIPEILAILEELGGLAQEHDNVMFAQRIFDFNGHKILAKKLKDQLTLLVLMQKRGYVSLAMLDIENSIRRIHEILENEQFN